jgi:hypothetical protein
MTGILTFRVNGIELQISDTGLIQSRLHYFQDPLIASQAVHYVNIPGCDDQILNRFLSVAASDDYSHLPTDPDEREVWEDLADHFGWDQLSAELREPEVEPDRSSEFFVGHFLEIVLSDQFASRMPEDPGRFKLIVQNAMSSPGVRNNAEVHMRIADYLLDAFPMNAGYWLVFEHLDFSLLRESQISQVFFNPNFNPSMIGQANLATVLGSIARLANRTTDINNTLRGQVERGVREIAESDPQAGPYREPIADIKRDIQGLAIQLNEMFELADRAKQQQAVLLRAMAKPAPTRALPRPRAEQRIAKRPGAKWEETDNLFPFIGRGTVRITGDAGTETSRRALETLLLGKSDAIVWSSSGSFPGNPSITFDFPRPRRYFVIAYELQSGVPSSNVQPSMIGWTLEGFLRGKWFILDHRPYTRVLCDGALHRFELSENTQGEFRGLRLTMTDRNAIGTTQLYLSGFKIVGKYQDEAPRYGTPMNLAKLVWFLVAHLVNHDRTPRLFPVPEEWGKVDIGSDLDLDGFAKHLRVFLDLVAFRTRRQRPELKDESPLYMAMRTGRQELAHGCSVDEAVMWRATLSLFNSMRLDELRVDVTGASEIRQLGNSPSGPVFLVNVMKDGVAKQFALKR